MQQTRGELLTEFLGFVTEQGDAIARTVAESVLNRSLQSLWLKHPWLQFTSTRPVVITTKPNVPSYALPLYFGRLGEGRVRNLTLGRELHPVLLDDYDRAIPVNTTVLDSRRGPPSSYILGGTEGVEVQPDPVAGWALEVWSTDTGDTDVLITLEVRDAPPGQQRRQQFTLQGNASVPVGTWGTVDEFSKSFIASVEPGTTAGTLPLTSSRGTVLLATAGTHAAGTGTYLQTLFPQESARTHLQITFDPMPDGVYDIAIPVIRNMRRLTSDSDQLPSEWGPAVMEDMLISWRVNTGELGLDANIARPAFLDLVAYDNTVRPARSTVPFGVGR